MPNLCRNATDFLSSVFRNFGFVFQPNDTCRSTKTITIQEKRHTCDGFGFLHAEPRCFLVRGLFHCNKFAKYGRGRIQKMLESMEQFERAVLAVGKIQGSGANRFNLMSLGAWSQFMSDEGTISSDSTRTT